MDRGPHLVLGAICLMALLAPASAGAADARAPLPYDFDADGRQELVVGMPTYSRGVKALAGAVLIVESDRRGATAARSVLTHGSLGLPTETSDLDQLGSSVASGDFDGDGHADLVALAAGYGGDGGLVTVPGSAGGLRAGDARLLPRPGYLTPYDALVAGDLNRDGYDDLVVAVSLDGYREDRPYDPGTIRIYLGGAGGLGDVDPRRILPPPRAFGTFAAYLALGDVDADGHLDLVTGSVGGPYIVDGEGGYPGHRSFCRGGPSGPVACRALRHGGPAGPTSLAVADVTGDGRADIVEGRPLRRHLGEEERAPSGVVRVWRGTRHGPAARPIEIGRGDPGVPGRPARDDFFGETVAAADVDADGRADMVIASGDERVTVLRGGPAGYARSGNRIYDQDTRGVPGRRRSGQGFGATLSLLDLDGDGRPDLAAGAPTELEGAHASVFTLPGERGGFTGAGSRVIRGRAVGVPDADGGAVPFEATPFGAVLGRAGSSG